MNNTTVPANFLSPKATPVNYPTPLWQQPQVVVPQITNIPQPMQQPAAQAGDDLYQVQGMDGAKRFPTRPNSRYVLFDTDNDVFYIKVTDQNNYPVSLRRFCFIEEEEPTPVEPQYVTMDEFTKFKEELLNGIKHLRTESGTSAESSAAKQHSGK